MKKIVARDKILAFLLAILVISSSFLNVSVVLGNEEGVLGELKNVKLVNAEAIGATDGEAAYVKYNEELGLDFSGCKFGEDISNMKLKSSSDDEVQISTAGTVSMPKADGEYFVVVEKADGTTETYTLGEFMSFSKIYYDWVQMIVESISIGGTPITNSSDWVTDENCTLNVSINVNTDTLVGYKAILNDNDVALSISGEKSLKAEANDVKSAISSDNTLVINLKNKFGTESSFTYNFKYDPTKPSISDVTLSGNYFVVNDTLYTKKGTEVSASVNYGSSGVKTLSITKDEDVVASAFPVKLDNEGTYGVFIETGSGESYSSTLFDGKKIKFDDTAPEVNKVVFNNEDVDFSKWYNIHSKLEFYLEDEVGVASVELKVNDVDTPISQVVDADSGVTKYVTNSADFTVNDEGIYKLELITKDNLGNTGSYDKTLKIDTANPSYEGLSVDNKILDGDTYYFDNGIQFSGSFSDKASGVKDVKYKDVESAEYESVSFPFTAKETGLFRVEDNAGNTEEYSVIAILNMLGISPAVVDKDTPKVEREWLAPDFIFVGEHCFAGVPTLNYTVTDSNIKVVEFYVNGVEQKSTYSKDGKYSFTPNGVVDGKVTVKVVAIDKVNHIGEDEYTFIIDTTAPSITKATAKEPNNQKGGKVYYQGSFDVQVSAEDIGLGVSKYSLNDVISSDGKFTISESGEYVVKAYDLLGNESASYKLSDLLGWGSNTVVIDNSKPVVTSERPSGESVDKSNWYGSQVTFTINVKDNLGIDNAYVTINGVKVDSVSFDGTDEVSAVLHADTSKVNANSDGSYVVKAYAYDNGKLEGTWSDTIYIDMSAPSDISVDIPNPTNIKGENVYYTSNIDLEVKAKDFLSGIKGYYLNDEYSESGKFTISADGEYSIRVVDALGNISKSITLKDLCKWSANNIVIDSVNPIITGSRPDGESSTVKDWYSKEVVYEIPISDNRGINKAYVKINGVEVDTFNTDKVDVKSTTLYADTSKVGAVEGNKYIISVYVEDNGKLTDTWEDTIYIDMDTPNNVKANAVTPANQKGDKVFYNAPFKVSMTANDQGSGIGTYYLNDVSSPDGLFTVSENGYYLVKVEDALGNTTSKISLGELLGWDSNEVVFDKDKPVIDTNRPDGESTSVKNWFNKDVVYDIKVADNIGIDSAVVTINGTKVDEFNTKELNKTKITLKADTSKVSANADSSYDVKIFVKDNSGLWDDWSDTIYIDKKSPTNVSAVAPTPSNQKGNKVYFTSEITVNVSANDSDSGIAGYKLNGTVSSDGKFTISTDGKYYVSAYDKLGNESKKVSLASLLGWSSNDIVFDLNDPVINVSKPSGESPYKAKWYGNDVSYNVSLSDNKGINSAKIVINGSEESVYHTSLIGETSITLTANTANVKANDDGSYNISVTITDNANRSSHWSDTIYIDKTTPSVSEFLISGDVNSYNTSNDNYGFFFNGSGAVEVKVSDKGITSGIRSISVKVGEDEWKEYVTDGGSVVNIPVPENFKGFIQVYVKDNVGHKSATSSPSGFVSETSNTHKNYSNVNISLPETDRFDENNLPLYSSNATFVTSVNCNWSGLKKLTWGINDETIGEINDFSKASTWDRNLPLKYDISLISTGNSNIQTIWVKVVDNANHTSENSRQFSIDKDRPIISVEYDKTNDSGYYNSNRTATITVNERNFDSSKFSINGTTGNLGSWHRKGNVWTNTITFSSDNLYDFSLSCVDRAGNRSNTYTSGAFTIDKTDPSLTVSWGSDSARNSNYYNAKRTATIAVLERNFDSSLISVTGATLGSWSADGDTHTATVTFNDGEHEMSITGKDRAGNEIRGVYKSGRFIVDTATPKIKIDGVSNGISYKEDVGISVTVDDAHLDKSSTRVRLYGKNHQALELTGTFNETEGTYSYSNFPKKNDVDDIYTLEVVVSDMAGNTTKEEVVFSVNRFGSKYSVYNEGVVGNYLNSAQDITITELNVDKIDTSKVKVVVTLNGKEIEVPKEYISIVEEEKDGKYLYTYIISKDLFTKDGKYSIQIFSKAEDGTEYTSAAEQYDFMLDTTPASIVVSGVEDGVRYQDYSRKVTIDVRDLSGVDSIKVLLNGKEVETSLVDGMYMLTITESSEPQTLEVVVTDLAGNVGSYTVKDFIISSDVWSYLINQLWFKLVIIGLGIGVILLILVLVLRKKKDTKEEEKLAKENEAYYKSSSNSSGKGSSSEDKTSLSDDVQEKTEFVNNDSDNSKTDIIE